VQKALVLGNISRTILSVIRSLGRGGIEVHIAWNNPDCVSLSSRYVRQAHPLPPYVYGNTAWLDALCKLMDQERFDLVIPCSDVDTLACCEHRAELEKWGRVYTPNPEACDILFDKHKTNDLAKSLGVRIPRELIVTSLEQAQGVFQRLGVPVVVKPRRTFDMVDGKLDLGVRKAGTPEELSRVLPTMLVAGPVAIQENFVGQGAGIELLLKDGEPLMAFQHLRVHEPLHGGQSAYRKSVPVSADLLEAAIAILRAVRYTGVAMVEFKINPITLEWVLIEVNARFWGSLPLAVAAGAEFPLALFQLLVEGKTPVRRNYRNNIFCRNLSLDLEWQLANLFADRRDPTLATKPLFRVFSESLVNFLSGRERWDTCARDDPGPAFAELRQLARRLLERRTWRRMQRVIGDARGDAPARTRSCEVATPEAESSRRRAVPSFPENTR
jgi:predicted ATP-grasp superfamily ATP-dependent carboligase